MYEETTIVVGKDIAIIIFAKSFIDIQYDVNTKVHSTLLDDDVEFEEIAKETVFNYYLFIPKKIS